MRRYILLLLCISLFGLFTNPIATSAKTIYIAKNSKLCQSNIAKYNKIATQLHKNILKCKTKKYTVKIKTKDCPFVEDMLAYKYFYWSDAVDYSYQPGKPYNTLTFRVSEYKKQLKQEQYVNRALNNIVTTLQLKSLPSIERANAINQYICEHFSYRVWNANATHNDKLYSFIKYKQGACLAYTELFNRLCEKVGLKAYRVDNLTHAHTWSILILNGNTYHCDPTWNDTTPSHNITMYHMMPKHLYSIQKSFKKKALFY